MIKVLDDPNYTGAAGGDTWLRGSLRRARRGQERRAIGADVHGAVRGVRNAAGVDLGQDYCGVGGGETMTREKKIYCDGG